MPHLIVFLALCCIPTAVPASPSIEVEFVAPEKFADAGRGYGDSADLAEIRRFLEQRASGLLGEAQKLSISITEFDMAGEREPWRALAYDLRVMRGVYPPRIDLRFRLTRADGAVLKEGERQLRDSAFELSGTRYRDDPLRYEKALLEDWLDKEFGGR